MGILDDAIREHLELKRAHGASEEEVRFKEAEVFGPVRQEAAPEAALAEDQTALMQPADLDAEAVQAAPVDEHEPVSPPAVEQHEPLAPPVEQHEHVEAASEDPYAVHPGDHAVPDPHHEGEPGGSDPAWGEDTEFFSEPAQARHHHTEERHPALHDTDEHFRGHEHPPEPVFRPAEHAAGGPEAPVSPGAPVEDPPVDEPPVEEPAGEPGEEDVLEETPEFLQDAPEHDRLWFEQKPPRDFDFGE